LKIKSFRVAGIRCFEDTLDVELSPRCNIFVGQNNTGKSTLLRALMALQGQGFSANVDLRSGSASSYYQVQLVEVPPQAKLPLRQRPQNGANIDAARIYHGTPPNQQPGFVHIQLSDEGGLFMPTRPYHGIIPFLARRKASAFDQNIAAAMQANVSGTLSNLYSRIDLVATSGHPRHDSFRAAVNEIVGIPITTKASPSGKEAGFYLSDDEFVTLERMGDGITEMVALIVELCLERDRIFILEEPETNLHPKGLKALLAMVMSSTTNQFVIATHSNIVVRELGSDNTTKIFHLYRDGLDHKAASHITAVGSDQSARMNLLRELGYEFVDLGLFEAWLFLEESSAEQVVGEILIPLFVPALKGRLRTYSAAGVTNVEPSVSEFQRLITYLHLEPAYRDRIWVRTDGDSAGTKLWKKFGRNLRT
jgi:predicted ATPase